MTFWRRIADFFDAASLRCRNRYLKSVNNARRLEAMTLREENLRLREIARIAHGAEVPKLPEFAWVQASDIQRAVEKQDGWQFNSIYGFPARKIEETCVCMMECGVGCKGQCGCKLCYRNYMDFLSGRDE